MSEARIGRGESEQDLPEYLAVVLGRLGVPEVQRLRLVCKDWRRAVSDAFTGKLQPNQLATAVVAFPNATALSCKAPQNKLRLEDFHCMGQLKQLTSLELSDDHSLGRGRRCGIGASRGAEQAEQALDCTGQSAFCKITPNNDSGFKALLSMPRLRTLHCDELGLADWQYAEYKNRYLGRIRMIAGKTEERILQKHHIFRV